MNPPLAADFVALLAHPTHPDHPPLEQRQCADGDWLLLCEATGEGFPIESGIPRLLPESAISPDRVASMMEAHD